MVLSFFGRRKNDAVWLSLPDGGMSMHTKSVSVASVIEKYPCCTVASGPSAKDPLPSYRMLKVGKTYYVNHKEEPHKCTLESTECTDLGLTEVDKDPIAEEEGEEGEEEEEELLVDILPQGCLPSQEREDQAGAQCHGEVRGWTTEEAACAEGDEQGSSEAAGPTRDANCNDEFLHVEYEMFEYLSITQKPQPTLQKMGSLHSQGTDLLTPRTPPSRRSLDLVRSTMSPGAPYRPAGLSVKKALDELDEVSSPASHLSFQLSSSGSSGSSGSKGSVTVW